MIAIWIGTARAFAAMVLVVSGGTKVFDVGGFAATLRVSGVPRKVARYLAIGLLSCETAFGIALSVTGSRLMLFAAGGLFAGFAAYHVVAGRRPHGTSCHCFGTLLHLPPGAVASMASCLPLLALAFDCAVYVPHVVPVQHAGWLVVGGCMFGSYFVFLECLGLLSAASTARTATR